MKRTIRIFLSTLFIIIILLTAGFFLPSPQRNKSEACARKAILHIGSNGFHTSFLLPVNNGWYDWRKDFEIPSEIQYIEFGWGNREFYMSRDFSIKATIKALFPSETVVHVVYLNATPEIWFKKPRDVKVFVCPRDYLNIVQYIRSSFHTSENGDKLYLGKGLYGPSSFFKGTGNYHAFKTCNTWVAEGLREAHIRTPLWAGTAQSIMWHLKRTEIQNKADEK